MLIFGYTYISDPDPFSESPTPDRALVLTEDGRIITGNDTHAAVEDAPGPVSGLILRQLADTVRGRHADYVRNFGDTSIPLTILNIDDDLTPELLAARFLEDTQAGKGRAASSREFVSVVGLHREVESDLETTAEDNSPAPEDAGVFNPEYAVRQIGGMDDVRVLRDARAARMTVLLSGEPGTGKTALCDAAFGPELVTVSCNDGMIMADLVGQWMPVPNKPGDFTWHDGPLLVAMSEGRPLLLDDFSWASTTVQAGLLPVLDHRRSITIIDRPEESEVKAADGFCVVLTENPSVGIGITEPILSRVAFTVQVASDLATAERLGVSNELLAVAYQLEDNAQAVAVEGGRGWVPSIRILLEATRIQQVFGIEFAASTFLAACPIEDENYRGSVQALLHAQLGRGARVSDGLKSVSASQ